MARWMVCGQGCVWAVFLLQLLSQTSPFGWFVARGVFGPFCFHSSFLKDHFLYGLQSGAIWERFPFVILSQRSQFGWFLARSVFGPFSFGNSLINDHFLDGLWPGLLLDRVPFTISVPKIVF